MSSYLIQVLEWYYYVYLLWRSVLSYIHVTIIRVYHRKLIQIGIMNIGMK